MTPTDATQALPDAMTGHWDTPEGRDFAVEYLAKDRASLCMGNLSDFHLANAQYLEDISVGTVTFQSAIGIQTAAKERIRWLSAQLAAANVELASLRQAHSLPGDVGTILREMADTNFSVSGKNAEQIEAWFREQASKALAALTPSALAGDAGGKND